MYKDLIQTFNLPDVVIAKSYENWKFFLNDKGELFWNRHNETRKYNIIEKVLCFDLIFNKQIILEERSLCCPKVELILECNKLMIHYCTNKGCFTFYPGYDERKVRCCIDHNLWRIIKKKEYYFCKGKIYYYNNGCRIVLIENIINIIELKNRILIHTKDKKVRSYTLKLNRLENEDIADITTIIKTDEELIVLRNGKLYSRDLSALPCNKLELVNLKYDCIKDVQSSGQGLFIFVA